MIRFRHYIPFTFAIIALGLSSYIGSKTTRVFGQTQPCSGDAATTFGPIQLEAGKNYDLGVFMPKLRRPPDGFAGTMFVTLEDNEGELLFEIEDSYWAQSGTWYEDGESGTWYENNVSTIQYFHAQESGTYTVKIRLNLPKSPSHRTTNMSISPSPTTAVVVYVDRRYASASVFAITALFLIGLGILSMTTRGYAYRKRLANAKLGDQIKYKGERYQVDDVWDFTSYKGGPLAKNVMHQFDCELKLLADNGAVRYLSLETHDYENGEGDDVDYDIVVWTVPVEASAVTHSAGTRSPQSVEYQGETYYRDGDKSGFWYGKSRYQSGVNGQANDCVFINVEPYAKFRLLPGKTFVTRSDDDGDVEWYASTVIKWKRVILKSNSAQQPTPKNT